MKLSKSCLKAFEKDVLARYPEEACGLVVNGEYVSVPNVSETPLQTFRIAPEVMVRFLNSGLQAILHSHPYDPTNRPKYDAQWPSTKDMQGWLDGNIPWGICATDGEGITQLVWLDEANPEPLVGREFIHGINDCYSVVRDWYRMERGITLINMARGMEWWDNGENYYDAHFERAGFVTIPFKEATIGDGVLFKVRSPVTNHAAVITGENEILHHLFHRLSGHDSLSKWAKVINRAVRYVGPKEQ